MEENKFLPEVTARTSRNNYEIAMTNGYHATLKRDVDFGMIYKKDKNTGELKPITNRPTLFASGKDKILTGFGLVYLSEIEDQKISNENGEPFFYYMVKSTAYFMDKPVRTAYGCANSAEKSGGFASAYDLANTALKKAVKRAEVALAIKLANLSDMFVQDLEDTNIDKEANELQKDDDNINAKQIKRIFAIASTVGLSVEQAKQFITAMGFASTKDIKVKDYDEICEKLQNYNKEN